MAAQEDRLDWGALSDSVGLKIRLAETLSAQQMAALLQDIGLSAAQLTALELVGCNPGIQPGRLAKALALEPSNMASMLRRLEAMGCLRTVAGQDRRTKALSLTRDGERLRQAGETVLKNHRRQLTQALSRSEADELLRLLDKLIE